MRLEDGFQLDGTLNFESCLQPNTFQTWPCGAGRQSPVPHLQPKVGFLKLHEGDCHYSCHCDDDHRHRQHHRHCDYDYHMLLLLVRDHHEYPHYELPLQPMSQLQCYYYPCSQVQYSYSSPTYSHSSNFRSSYYYKN